MINQWELQFEAWLRTIDDGDAAHGLTHIKRVVANAKRLAAQSEAQLAVVLPAAWLHDCVTVPKDSPLRSHASRLAAKRATQYLTESGYDQQWMAAIHHAIEAHSFSANITPTTLEAQIVQDADRLDALGAIGIARCIQTGTTMGRELYDVDEPFPISRPPDDNANTIDHFYTKLLRLAATMQTEAGRREAVQRSRFMQAYLDQLQLELSS